jgi:hypothetical protein
MKYRIGFKLDWLEMIFILVMIFFSGMLITSEIESKFVYVGLLIFGAGILLIKKRVKLPMSQNKPK